MIHLLAHILLGMFYTVSIAAAALIGLKLLCS